MSARQPFVPSRPASRAVERQDNAPATASFVPHPANPVHRDSTMSQKPQGSNKPLNISGLLKRNDSQSSRRAQPPQRPGTAEIFSSASLSVQNFPAANDKEQSLKIMAPAPSQFRSSTPASLFSANDTVHRAFMPPSAPVKPASRSFLDTTEVDAHIPTLAAGAERSLSPLLSQALKVPPLKSDSVWQQHYQNSDHSRSLERNIDTANDFDHPGIGFNTRPTRESGPVRIPMNARSPLAVGRRQTLDEDELTHEQNDRTSGSDLFATTRISQHKRSRGEFAEEDNEEDIPITKRRRHEAEATGDNRWKVSMRTSLTPTLLWSLVPQILPNLYLDSDLNKSTSIIALSAWIRLRVLLAKGQAQS
jgi:hypothetical protein